MQLAPVTSKIRFPVNLSILARPPLLASLESANIGGEPLSVIEIFHSSLHFNKCKQKSGPLEIRGGNHHVFADNRWTVLPSLLLADGCYLGISQQLSNTL
jgi:hypothetical protein